MKIHTIRKWLGITNIAFVVLALIGILSESGAIDVATGLLLILMSVSAYYLIINKK